MPANDVTQTTGAAATAPAPEKNEPTQPPPVQPAPRLPKIGDIVGYTDPAQIARVAIVTEINSTGTLNLVSFGRFSGDEPSSLEREVRYHPNREFHNTWRFLDEHRASLKR